MRRTWEVSKVDGCDKTLDDLLDEAPETTKEPAVIALVDGDIVAHKAANATDGRQYELKDYPGAWKYKSDIEAHCKEHDIPRDQIQLCFEPEPEKNAFAICSMIMKSIRGGLEERHKSAKFQVFLSVPSNTLRRKEINPAYKENRKDAREPKHLKACKEYIRKKWNAVSKDAHEADDLLAMTAEELGPDKLWVICSIDKDLKQIPGRHYNWDTDDYKFIGPESARSLLWFQVLIGDSTDNIFTPRLLGEKKAEALIKNINFQNTSDQELFALCEEQYAFYMEKYMKVKDTSDAACWVLQTYEQVKLGQQVEDIVI